MNIRFYSSAHAVFRVAMLGSAIVVLAGCPAKEFVKQLPFGIGIQCKWPTGNPSGYKCGIYGGIGRPPALNSLAFAGGISAPALSTSVDWGILVSSDLYIDTAGTTATIPAAGIIRLSVVDGNGYVLAAQNFGWYRNGPKLYFSEPASVQAWTESFRNNPQATQIKYEIQNIDVPAQGQWVVIKTSLVAVAEPMATASYSFRAVCPKYDSPYQCIGEL